MFDLRKILSVALVYRAFGKVISGKARSIYVQQYVKPQSGERILDIGCGPADVLAWLPDVEYTGIDINPRYIRAAQARYGERGSFLCSSVAETAIAEPASYDVVLATGILHHLDHDEAAHLLHLAAKALKPAGRLITFDGCYVPRQSRLARFLLRMDRGNFVRTPEEYEHLARAAFRNIRTDIRQDLLRIPYTHFIMTCTAPVHDAVSFSRAS